MINQSMLTQYEIEVLEGLGIKLLKMMIMNWKLG